MGMAMALDYAGVRERLGMPVVPMPRVRRELIQREKPEPEPVALASIVAPEAALPIYAPFNFYKRSAPEAVIHLVALKHGFKYHDIIGTGRSREMMLARREAVRLITTHCRPMSLVQIGRLFHKNHATIINLLRRKPRASGGEKRLILRLKNDGALSETAIPISEAVA
jgi:hypothetical protein